MGPKNPGGVISEKTKGPCQETPGCRPSGRLPKIVDFQVLDEKIDSTPKMKLSKMMTDIISTHWNAPNL